jgi:DNA mismatch repair protein MutS2
VPGKSYALQVAKRLGLSDEVIERAYGKLSEGHLLLEEDIGRLEQLKSKMEQDLVALREELSAEHARGGEIAGRNLAYISFGLGVIGEALEQAEKTIRRGRELSDGLVKTTVEDLRQARESIVREAREERERLLREAEELDKADEPPPEESDVAATVDSLSEGREKKIRAAKMEEKAAATLQDGVEEAAELLLEDDPGPVDLKSLSKGDLVYVRTLKVEGEVIEVNLRSGRVTVSIGGIASTVKPDELRFTGRKNSHETDVKLDTSSLDRRAYRKVVGTTLDLHGLRVDEALDELERYLDEAFVAHHRRVILLHGIGTGALRNAVRSYLHKHPLVDSYAKAEPQDGGAGATSVHFVGGN